MQYLIASFLAATATLSSFALAVHIGFRAPRRVERGTPAEFGLPYREVSVRTSGGKRLFAWWVPATASGPTMILMHGWGGNAELMLPLAVPFHTAGFNVLLLDARNHGRSDSASFSSLPRFAEDIASAINWVKTHSPASADRIVLLGHSVGAGAALLEASRRNDISAVISVSAFAHPEWMMRRYLARLGVPRFLATWVIRYVEFIIGHRYDDIAPINTACQVTCPVLLVHGKADKTVPVTDAIAIHDNCNGNCPELILIDAVGHDSAETVHEHVHELLAFLRCAGMIS